MCVNHHDKCWWQSFCKDVKRAFRKNDFQMKVELFKQYQRHMDARMWREYYYFKRLDFQELKEKGLVDERADFYDWLKKNPY